MPWHDRKPDPWYAIRRRKGPTGIVYRVSFTRHGKNIAKLFRARDYANAKAALKTARGWRDNMSQSLLPETKQEFSQRLRPSWADPVAALAHRPLKRGATPSRGVDAATDASIWSLPCEQSEVIPVEGVMLKLQIREIGAQLPGGNAESDSERATVPAVPDFWVCSWEALCGGIEGVERSVDGMQPDVQET